MEKNAWVLQVLLEGPAYNGVKWKKRCWWSNVLVDSGTGPQKKRQMNRVTGELWGAQMIVERVNV